MVTDPVRDLLTYFAYIAVILAVIAFSLSRLFGTNKTKSAVEEDFW